VSHNEQTTIFISSNHGHYISVNFNHTNKLIDKSYMIWRSKKRYLGVRY